MSKNHLLRDYALINIKTRAPLGLFQFGAVFDTGDPDIDCLFDWDSHYLKIQYREAWGNNWLHPRMTKIFEKDRWS